MPFWGYSVRESAGEERKNTNCILTNCFTFCAELDSRHAECQSVVSAYSRWVGSEIANINSKLEREINHRERYNYE